MSAPPAIQGDRTRTAAHDDRREARLEALEDGKTRLWRRDLRITQIVHIGLMLACIGFVSWQRWALWSVCAAAAFDVLGVWGFARRMAPREERLRRVIAALAVHRRCCAGCGYRLRDLSEPRCPECGAAFDPHDDRHVLTRDLLRLHSNRGRTLATLSIIFVLFMLWSTIGGAAWPVQAGLIAALAAAFHALHFVWNRRSAADERRLPPRPENRCPQCDAPLPTTRPPPSACPRCDGTLTCGDVFVRPHPAFRTDRRIRSLQYQALMLRFVFLAMLLVGMSALMRADPTAVRRWLAGMSGPLSFVALLAPVLIVTFGLTIAFRAAARRVQARSARLLVQVRPSCPRCGADVSAQRVGAPCARCGRPVPSTVLTG